MKDKILNWFANGQTGLSSKAMAKAVAGINEGRVDHPGDPDDLNRCLLFLKAVPEARLHLDKVSLLSDYWKALIERFEEVEESFINEVGFDWSKAKSAPKTYALMKSIFEPIERNDKSVIRFGNMSIKTS